VADTEIHGPVLANLDTMAGEVMWDAILANVPQERRFTPPKGVVAPEEGRGTSTGSA
jgi:hypothetical protein